jgi:hypothetical protein
MNKGVHTAFVLSVTRGGGSRVWVRKKIWKNFWANSLVATRTPHHQSHTVHHLHEIRLYIDVLVACHIHSTLMYM